MIVSQPTLLLYHSLSLVLPLPSPCPLNSHAHDRCTSQHLSNFLTFPCAYSIKHFSIPSMKAKNVDSLRTFHFPKSWRKTKPQISSCFIDATDTADGINKTCFVWSTTQQHCRSTETYKFIMHLFAAASHFLNLPLLSDRNNRLVFWKQRLCRSIKGPWPFAHRHLISPLSTTHSAD